MKCVSAFYLDRKSDFERMVKSLHYFHPDLTEEFFTREDLIRLKETDPDYNWTFHFPYLGQLLGRKYDFISHIDADVIIVDRIDKLFDDSYEIIAGRNNSDNNMAGTIKGWELPGIDWTKYINSGVHACSGRAYRIWFKECLNHGMKMILKDQDVLNELFYSKNFRVKLLDPIESNVHWGTSFEWGTTGTWDSWKLIKVVDDHLEINNKRIKMLHSAGGGGFPKLSDVVTKEVEEFIQEIVK